MSKSPAATIELVKGSSLPLLCEQLIEERILDGRWAPGHKINEKELALRLGVSRGPIREALRTLEGAGLLEQIPNRGVFVRQLSWSEVSDVYEVRAVIFGLAGRLLSQRATQGHIDRLRVFTAEMDASVAVNDIETYVRLNFQFHEYIVRETGNRALAEEYLGLIKQLRLYRTRNITFGNSIEASNREHHMMVEAIAARDPDCAAALHFAHVQLAKQRLHNVVSGSE